MGSSCGKACQNPSDESDSANLPLVTQVVETEDKLVVADPAKEEALPVVEPDGKAPPANEATPGVAEPSAAKDAEPEVEPKIASDVAAEVAAEAVDVAEAAAAAATTPAAEATGAAPASLAAAEATEADPAAAAEAEKRAEEEAAAAAAAKKAAAEKKRKAAAAAAKKKKEMEAKKKAAAQKKAETEVVTNQKEDDAKKEEEARKKAEEEEERKAKEAKKGYKMLDQDEKSETKGQMVLDGKGAIRALDGMIKLAAMQKKYLQGLQAEIKGMDTRNALFGAAIQKHAKVVWDLIHPIAEKFGFEQKFWHEVVLHESAIELAKKDRNIMTKIKKLASQLPMPDDKLAMFEKQTAA